MALLPTTLGTRPRLAVEIRPEGVIAARSEDAQALVSAVAYGILPQGHIVPGLRAGNILARSQTVAAVRNALESVALKERQITLVIPDAAVRVLLLDFDALPPKPAEALPIVRFRLKKLLPFDADDAVISYQVMSTQRGLIRVLAVAVPREVLAEYESIIHEAGFEPGAVLPSTLAACASLTEMDSAVLLVNAGETSVTTAIVQGAIILLHRTVDLAAEGMHDRVEDGGVEGNSRVLPLIDVESSAGEWAKQKPVSGFGVLDDDHIRAEADMQARRLTQEAAAEAAQNRPPVGENVRMHSHLPGPAQLEDQRLAAAAREVTQAVSVAAAYFEDTLQSAPGLVLAAGSMGADVLGTLLRDAGFLAGEMRVRELVETAMLTGGAVTTRVPIGWMAGVRGALRS